MVCNVETVSLPGLPSCSASAARKHARRHLFAARQIKASQVRTGPFRQDEKAAVGNAVAVAQGERLQLGTFAGDGLERGIADATVVGLCREA